MQKVYVVTGERSGIGRATAAQLEERGHRVIGVDRRDAAVTADLATVAGRAAMVDGVRRLAPDGIDGFVANAGLSPDQGDAEAIVRVNYFGAVATAEGLRPLMKGGGNARGVMIASTAILMSPDPAAAEMLLEGDEERAVEVLGGDPNRAYMTGKLAIAWWMRRAAVSADWAGAGIALNCIGPGVTDTPMNAALFAREEGRQMLATYQPNAMGRAADAGEVARGIVFLIDECPPYMIGQTLYVDGGIDALLRPRAY